ncbi:MAG: hypothetical protein KF696_02015 [Planctomycetes bacterium]|nr:hypothetical protein [Planctomycetota bacterium]MCW8134777.1 hypothetical protein [Planctomycetota bacterium]
MPSEAKQSALSQYGSIIGPVGGVVVAIGLVAAILVTDNVSDAKDALAKQNNRVKASLEATEVNNAPPGLEGPAQVKPTLEVAKGNPDALPGPADGLLRLPITWDVTLEGVQEDEFEQYDENKDGKWDLNEFRRTPYFLEQPPVNDFNAWDKNKDGGIDREEYNNRPGDLRKNFDRLKKNADDVLKVEDGEITSQQLREMDENQDGQVTFDEYRRWFNEGPVKIFALSSPSSLGVSFDPRAMTVNLSWSGASGGDLPDDLGYIIYRRAPEDADRARVEYGKRVQEYSRLDSAWEGRMKAWLDAPAKLKAGKPHPEGEADPNKKKFRDYVGRSAADQRKAYQEYKVAEGKADPAPVQPSPPEEWNAVNTTPVTGTSHSVQEFELDITYTYAVVAVTQRNLYRGTKYTDVKVGNDTYKASERVVQEGHPLRVRARIEMGDMGAGAAEGSGVIRLSRWINVSTGDSTNWYRASIRVSVSQGDPVGAEYSLAELRDRNLELVDLTGTAANLEVLPSDTRIKFATGYRFEGRGGNASLVRHTRFGDFELSNATRQPATVIPDASGSNPAEVWVVGLTSRARSAHFEISRWHQVGNEWYLVSLNVKADSGKAVGREVDLSSPGTDVMVYDSSGKEVGAAVLRGDAFKGQRVNLAVGNFEGVTGRVAKVDGKEFDLFATLYVD